MTGLPMTCTTLSVLTCGRCDMTFNIYWTERDGSTHSRIGLHIELITGLVSALMVTGAEITGIIDSSKD